MSYDLYDTAGIAAVLAEQVCTCVNRMLFKFSGQESEIDLDYADKEFLEYVWAELDELPKDVVHFKQAVYQHVAQKFAPYIQEIKSGCDSSDW